MSERCPVRVTSIHALRPLPLETTQGRYVPSGQVEGSGRCCAPTGRGHRAWTGQAGIANRDGYLATEYAVDSGGGIAGRLVSTLLPERSDS